MNPRLLSAIVIACVVLLDRVTKLYIRAAFSPSDLVPVIPDVFNIVHVENPGAAFGLLANAPAEWRGLVLVLLSGIVMAVIAYLLFRPHPTETPMTRLGLAIVLGGALGNMGDRLFRGTVTDFLQVFLGSYEFPSFNVADIAINVGAGLLILDMLRGGRKRSA